MEGNESEDGLNNCRVMTRNTSYPDTKDLEPLRQKIEVRVSLEEKQTLSKLAKQDGESVSGLIRGLVEKYMALNSANTVRKYPKWQIAAGLILAGFVGYSLSLIPTHLDDASTPIYMVHGAIGQSAFGVGVRDTHPNPIINIQDKNGKDMIVKLAFKPTVDGAGILNLKICEVEANDSCVTAGNSTASGKPIHIFIQEMA